MSKFKNYCVTVEQVSYQTVYVTAKDIDDARKIVQEDLEEIELIEDPAYVKSIEEMEEDE